MSPRPQEEKATGCCIFTSHLPHAHQSWSVKNTARLTFRDSAVPPAPFPGLLVRMWELVPGGCRGLCCAAAPQLEPARALGTAASEKCCSNAPGSFTEVSAP